MKIGLYGASCQAGASIYGGVTSYPNPNHQHVLQMMLDRQYGAGVHTVVNHAIGGTTLPQALGTPPIYPHGTILQQIDYDDEDIVMPECGVNEAYLPSYTPAQHKANVETVRNHVLARGKKFIYQSPAPINKPHDPLLASLHAAVMTIPGLKVADVRNAILSWYPQWQAHMSDGTHPNGIMYMFVGTILFSAVSQAIGS